MRQLFWTPVALCLVLAGCQESRPTVPVAQPVVNKESSPAQSAAKQEPSPVPETRPVAAVEDKSEPVAGDERSKTEATEVEKTRSGDFVIGEAVRYENLAVFPILSPTAKDDDRFITLDEGLSSGIVEVMEVGARQNGGLANDSNNAPAENAVHQPAQQRRRNTADPFAEQQPAPQGRRNQADVAGDVNHLLVVNRSDKPLYLMPGEVVVGGRQDRSIAAETIVEPTGEPVSVEVYCVEHGRWHRRGSADFAMLALALVDDADGGKVQELARKAAEGKFVGKAGNLSKKARFSAQAGEGQSRVWEEVGFANAANGVISGSDAFTGNYAQQDVREKFEPYLKHIEPPIAKLDRALGVVVAINGKVEMADVYESTPLFKKLWPKLLKGYALDAVAVADAKDASKVCTVAEAKTFLDKACESSIETTEKKGGLVVTVRAADGVKSFSAGTGGMAAGFGAGVHGAAY